MTAPKRTAVAYYRTSSATNVGADKDSLDRQQDAVGGYAKLQRLDVVKTFYDEAVSGGDPIDQRPGFVELLAFIAEHDVQVVLVENASRFARDLVVQITGHDLLKDRGVELIPADAPDFFVDEGPTATMVRQILGAVSQFEKASLVHKLRVARDRKSTALGRRIEGRKPVPEDVIHGARKLARLNPHTGKRRSLRQIAAALAEQGHTGPSGSAYGAESIRRMLVR
jgi:DNA invertase Pin-like site-specific DNA recombinase